ncbi:hypothetical protein Q1695_006330 [Nippostrongylus brasiliensis]|nr:hypothetical protein Q1695_006330 [Nippostrongylus brasiliensis]
MLRQEEAAARTDLRKKELETVMLQMEALNAKILFFEDPRSQTSEPTYHYYPPPQPQVPPGLPNGFPIRRAAERKEEWYPSQRRRIAYSDSCSNLPRRRKETAVHGNTAERKEICVERYIPKVAAKIINAAGFLHNLCIVTNEAEFDDVELAAYVDAGDVRYHGTDRGYESILREYNV